MNILSREKQIEVIAALCEGVGIRTAARLTGVNRGTVGTLALRIGLGCMELHDRLMVGIRTERLELDEAWRRPTAQPAEWPNSASTRIWADIYPLNMYSRSGTCRSATTSPRVGLWETCGCCISSTSAASAWRGEP